MNALKLRLVYTRNPFLSAKGHSQGALQALRHMRKGGWNRDLDRDYKTAVQSVYIQVHGASGARFRAAPRTRGARSR
eukprot:1800761-Rhodomonas_salina.1